MGATGSEEGGAACQASPLGTKPLVVEFQWNFQELTLCLSTALAICLISRSLPPARPQTGYCNIRTNMDKHSSQFIEVRQHKRVILLTKLPASVLTTISYAAIRGRSE